MSSFSYKESQDYINDIMENTGDVLEDLKVFDITLLDEEGKSVQPKGQMEVSFAGLDFIKSSSQIVAYYLGEKTGDKFSLSGNSSKHITVDSMDVEEKNGEAVFNTYHFSIYGVGTEATARYDFYVGEDIVDT